METMRKFKDGTLVRHFKYYKLPQASREAHEKEYQILAHAVETETGKTMVVYRELSATQRVFVRWADSFYSEVDRNKYPDALQDYRFELIEEGSI